MKRRLYGLEFGVSCLEDIRLLLKVWQRVVSLEGLGNSQARFVQVFIEDRLPGEEVKLDFTAEQSVLNRFLSALTEASLEYVCQDTIPGILTECRVIRDRGVLKAIGSDGQRGPESP